MEPLTPEALAAASDAAGLDRPIGFVVETGSTNADLRQAAERGAAHGTALAAGRQIAGRGRLGRVWHAPEGASLALSVVLRPPLPVARLPLVVLGAGVATVAACGVPCRLKWPNDVLGPDGRKIAGLLAEAELRGAALDFLVLGVGINVGAAPPDLPATCLEDLRGTPVDGAALAANVVAGVLRWTARAASDPASILAAWRRWSATLGRRVRVGDVEGTAVGLGPDGALEVRDDAGRTHRIRAGDVEMVRVSAG